MAYPSTGNGSLPAVRRTSETAQLAAIPLPGKKSLLDVVKAQVSAGLKLGALDRERATLEGSARGDDGSHDEAAAPPTPNAARLAWIAVVNHMVGGLRFVPKAQRATADEVLAAYLKAERAADQREARRRTAPTDEEPVEPSPAKPA